MSMVSTGFAAAVIIGAATLRIVGIPNDRITPMPSAHINLTQGGLDDVVQTGKGEMKVIDLRGGTRVMLRENSRFVYHYLPIISSSIATAQLQGEAAISVADKATLRVITSVGSAMLTTGAYAVRYEAGSPAMLVTVALGFATIRADTTRESMGLKAGQKGRLWKTGVAERVDPGTEWPSADMLAAPPSKPQGGAR